MTRARIALSGAALALLLAGACTPKKDPVSPATTSALAPGGGCNCLALAVAAEVDAAIQAEVARADGLYVRGDFAGAAAAYAAAHSRAPDPELVFAQGVATWRAGDVDGARASLGAYLQGGDMLAFSAQAQAALDAIEGRGGGVGGFVGGTAAAVGGVGATGVGVVGGVTGAVDRPKPKKLAKGAAIVLGIVAVGAVGAVGIHGIGSMADDVEFDTKFGLGMGVSGVVVGGTAVYLWGLTAATGAAASAPCLSDGRRPMITPFATADGGGVAAMGSF